MTKTTFNTMIHAPNRLQICALLESTKELEFHIIKEQLDVSDSVLSKHLKVLEDADYIRIIKKTEFTRQRTWLSLTSLGRKAKEQRTEKFLKLRRVDVLTHLKNEASLQRIWLYCWHVERLISGRHKKAKQQ